MVSAGVVVITVVVMSAGEGSGACALCSLQCAMVNDHCTVGNEVE